MQRYLHAFIDQAKAANRKRIETRRKKRPVPLNVEKFRRSEKVRYVGGGAPLSEGPLASEIARTGRLLSSPFQTVLVEELRTDVPKLHRKNWELGYILNALDDRGAIRDGARGLAFAVGRERTPSYLAHRGCKITATDLGGEDERSNVWNDTNQWSNAVRDLYYSDICDEAVFEANVSFRPVDMNDIPDDLRDFDFTWSTCSFEHCGSIELGLRFVREQMKCLRSGGVAVHTTEFNLSSNTDTFESEATVVFRLKDIETVVQDLEASGHYVEPLDIRLGDHPLDRHIDYPVYDLEKHMRLKLDNYASTSIGLIIVKDGLADAGNDKTKNGRP